ENALKGLEGIKQESIEVLFNSSRVRVNFDADITTIEAIEKAIEDLGYPVIKSRVKSA
ncbi:MAG TPA: heavy metal-associated domain-containing protein, partial [Pseudogracilibacillus sp.]|nr:heavy metal-associated domain-containing protein [Pseudogracilibacillus sp.]